MVVFWIIIVMLCLLATATSSALIALRLQSRQLDKISQEREAWQQAQEGRQRTWEVRQGKHILEAEKKLADQLKESRREWREWNVQAEQIQHDWQNRATLEQELARVPHTDHLELSPDTSGPRRLSKDWRPASLYRADLRGHDLSSYYMERADLREAQLAEANLYMADLSMASLTGANLERANLIGANLSGADLRGANLSGANFLVTDLHNTLLHGATLSGACNLSQQQLQTALYDGTTLIDNAVDITLPRLPGVSTRTPETTTIDAEALPELVARPAVDETATRAPAPTESPVSATTAPLPETSSNQARKTGNPTRKRTGKAKQPIATEPVMPEEVSAPAQTLWVKLEEQTDSIRETQEDEIAESDELPFHKIIQLQARVTKVPFLPDSDKQNNTKQRGEQRGHQVGKTQSDAGTGEDQKAQAN